MSVPIQAQFTMPPGFLTKENTSATANTPYSVFFGAYGNARMQIINGDWTGKSPVTVKSMFLRRDSEYYYSQVHSQARSWSNVKIQVADSAWTRSSSTFSKNVASTPTTIFNAPTSWRDTSAKPSANQAWGTHNMSFGFATPYYWKRQADIVMDFQFTGGKLANHGTWNAANYVMLDGFSDRVENGPFYNILLNKNCKQPGFMGATVKTNGQFHPRPNTMSLDVFQAFGAPKTPHFGAIGVLGRTTGINIGPCQELHLLHTPVVFRYVTSASGSWAQPRVYLPFNPVHVGLPFYSQAAFVHPTTRQFSLTGAMRSTIPAAPKWSGFKQLRVTASNANATVGTVDSTFVPIFRIN